jgi:hypothetical protein
VRTRLLALLVIVLLSACDIARDPVRLGKQTESEARAYAVQSLADQNALDREQERATQSRQDEIMIAETAQQSALYLEQLEKTAPWAAGAIVFVVVSLAIAVAVVTVGNSSANVIREHAKALRELARAAGELKAATEVRPEKGVLPGYMIPANVHVKIIDPATGSVIDSAEAHRASRPQLEARNLLYAKASVAREQVQEVEVEYPKKAQAVR